MIEILIFQFALPLPFFFYFTLIFIFHILLLYKVFVFICFSYTVAPSSLNSLFILLAAGETLSSRHISRSVCSGLLSLVVPCWGGGGVGGFVGPGGGGGLGGGLGGVNTSLSFLYLNNGWG